MLDLRLKLMAYVFISSASVDRAIAEHVRSLERGGKVSWIAATTRGSVFSP